MCRCLLATSSREPMKIEPERDREETKRLLYVALTRARDRLYLGIGRQGGALSADARESRGSAASIDAQLVRRSGSRPDDCFVDRRIAGSCDARVSGFGRGPPGSGRGGSAQARAQRGQTRRDDDTDFAPLDDRAIRRVTVSALSGDVEASTLRRSDGDRSSRWIGILVHRLLQREEFITEPSDDDLRRMAETMLDAAVLAELDDQLPLSNAP